jgi:hypothetical protein
MPSDVEAGTKAATQESQATAIVSRLVEQLSRVVAVIFLPVFIMLLRLKNDFWEHLLYY